MTLPEPLDYTIRVSPRARHARLVVRPGGAIEVVLPKGMPHRHVPALLAGRRQWLEHAVLRMREVAPFAADIAPPAGITLAAVGQHLHVDYVHRPDTALRMQAIADGLRLTGPVDDHALVGHTLREWLKRQGRTHLPPLLAELADRMDARYRQVSIRLQKTRWGSCSVQGNISLNARLLLLPPPLVRYVLVHELAHLQEHNHSPAFWQRVARFEPDYRRLRRELLAESRRMPGWVLA